MRFEKGKKLNMPCPQLSPHRPSATTRSTSFPPSVASPLCPCPLVNRRWTAELRLVGNGGTDGQQARTRGERNNTTQEEGSRRERGWTQTAVYAALPLAAAPVVLAARRGVLSAQVQMPQALLSRSVAVAQTHEDAVLFVPEAHVSSVSVLLGPAPLSSPLFFLPPSAMSLVTPSQGVRSAGLAFRQLIASAGAKRFRDKRSKHTKRHSWPCRSTN